MNPLTIASLQRYPVKGLSPEPLAEAALVAGRHFPGDRMFAVENGPSGFDPTAPEHQPKVKFLMLMRHERLAALATHYDDATGLLTIRLNGATLAEGDLATLDGRSAIERSLADHVGADALRAPVRLLEAPAGFRFMDSKSGYVSLINLASVRAIADAAGRRDLDPLRFRGNIHLEGLPPWGEFDLVDREIEVGAARLRVTRRIDRCAAVDVEPGTGRRDMRMVALLEERFRHHECGIYAEVVAGGRIRPGDRVVPV